MPRYGVLADIHGNYEALAAVLRYLETRQVDAWLCLGDIVGYNADPDRCAATVRDRGMDVVAGNHDLISIGRLGFARCARRPAYALRRTRRVLRDETATYLATLPPRKRLPGGVVLVHGGVEDVELYMRSAGQVAHNAGLLAAACPDARVCFFGHTHDACVWAVRDGRAEARAATGTVTLDDEAALYFVNPGSVDSARKPRPGHADCAVFDTTDRTVEFANIPYDHATAERKARQAGLRHPEWSLRLRKAWERL
jgi:predicted phosphodiesterase